MKIPMNSFFILLSLIACTSSFQAQEYNVPKEIIDLGALVTEDLPERVWGGLLKEYGFDKSNSFEVVHQKMEFPDGTISVSNSYLTLFNHGGPHVDVPAHVGLGAGIDSYDVADFIGPLKVIEVSHFPFGRSVPLSEIKKHDVEAGDIVIIYTNYMLPEEDEIPQRIALTQEAAVYLANLPVKAFGTDSYNVDSDDNPTEILSESALQRIAPIHFEFLSKEIPLFEQLFNVDKLLGKKNMYFVGQPLNIEAGDGMMVRPVVFVYD